MGRVRAGSEALIWQIVVGLRRSRASSGVGIRCLDRSAPAPVEVQRPAGTEGKAPTGSITDRTRGGAWQRSPPGVSTLTVRPPGSVMVTRHPRRSGSASCPSHPSRPSSEPLMQGRASPVLTASPVLGARPRSRHHSCVAPPQVAVGAPLAYPIARCTNAIVSAASASHA
jgi:hypothetical protein